MSKVRVTTDSNEAIKEIADKAIEKFEISADNVDESLKKVYSNLESNDWEVIIGDTTFKLSGSVGKLFFVIRSEFEEPATDNVW